jgi:hypothetical protein
MRVLTLLFLFVMFSDEEFQWHGRTSLQRSQRLERACVLLQYLSFEVEMQAFIVLYVLCTILMLS